MIVSADYDGIMNRKRKLIHDGTKCVVKGSNRQKGGSSVTKDEFAARMIAMTDVLYRVAWSQLPQAADREDAVQETIRRAWEKRERLRDERFMQTWVIRILLNVCDNMRRKNARMVPTEYIPAAQGDTQKDTPMLRVLFSLEEKYRLPLQLRYIEGYSVAETARILRLPEGTVKSRLSRGRDKLQALLKEEVFGE